MAGAPSHGGRFNGWAWACRLGLRSPCAAGRPIIGAWIGLLRTKVGLNAFCHTRLLTTLRGLQIASPVGQSIFELRPASPTWATLVARAARLDLGVHAAVRARTWRWGWFRHGRSLYAIGGNVDAARAAGIRTDR